MRRIALSLAIIGLGLPLLAASPAQAQAARTWVSGLGDDANMASNCSRSMPCKTFAAAISKTTVGGEINCLDPGGFGQVGITFTITISCEAATGGILAPNNTTGVLIDDNDTGTAVVTLRGLDIDGQGSGQFGIWINSAKAVHIENSTIRNFRGAFARSIVTAGISTIYLYVADTVISDNSIGISLESLGGYKVASLKNVVITGSTSDGLALKSSNVFVNVAGSVISGNGGNAVVTYASGTTANIERSTMANNGFAGLNAGVSGSTIRISGNGIYNNTYGVLFAQGATIQSDGTNKHGNSNGGVQGPNASLARQ